MKAWQAKSVESSASLNEKTNHSERSKVVSFDAEQLKKGMLAKLRFGCE